MIKKIKFCLFLAIVFLFLCSTSFSQNVTVKLDGVAKDQKGNPIPNATVLAINKKTNHQAKTITDDQGKFTFRNMQPGKYKILLVGYGIRSGDVEVDSEILEGFNYELLFQGQTGKLFSFVRVGQIKFVITDKKGKQITNAVLKFTGGSLIRVQDQNDIAVVPRENGYFPVIVSGGSVTFTFDPRYLPIRFEIKAPRYKSQQKRVELKPDDSITLTFRLKKKGFFSFFK